MPYVECPSCKKTSYTAAAYNTLELCHHCGEGLPLRRRVVRALAARPRKAPEKAATAAGAKAATA